LLDDTDFKRPAINKPLIGVAVAVLIAACGGWYYWHKQSAPASSPDIAPPAASPAMPVADEAIQHPLPGAADAEKVPLPALNESDVPFREALVGAVGDPSVAQYLVPETLIRHIVVTVDNLPRQKVAMDKRPLSAVPGSFNVNGDELHATLDEANFERYQPLVEVLRKADIQQIARVYLHFYPLFQKSYQDLGYPSGYFNDRLVQVIDSLLATPKLTGPIELVRPNVMYVFADPALEARPAGQKLLMRMGPDNEAAVKEKLAELRALITTTPPKH
jgi:Protein of unknown function (DUF3014)